MTNVRNILLGATLFAFVGCGTDGTPELGGQQGAMGQYNNTFGSQDVAGIWTVQSKQEYFTLDMDENGNVYNVPTGNNQKQKIASYSLSSNQELKITTNDGGQTVATYVQADQNSNNCFYVDDQFSKQGNPFTGQKVRELWCKKVASNNQGNVAGGGTFTNDKRPTLPPVTEATRPFKDYLYPSVILDGSKSRYYEYVHNYNQDAQGNLKYDGYVKKSFSRSRTANALVIKENLNDYEHKTDEIYSDKIISFTKNNYGYDSERYPIQVATNSKVVTVGDGNVEMTCYVKDITGGQIDLANLIPQSVQQDMILGKVEGSSYTVDQFTYVGVMHIFCGASNGIVMDSYHVNGWGEVLNIVQNPDGSGRYEILDKKSVQY